MAWSTSAPTFISRRRSTGSRMTRLPGRRFLSISTWSLRKRMCVSRLVDHASWSSTSSAVSHFGSIGQASFAASISPVSARARHFGPPPTEPQPHAPVPSPRHLPPVITGGSILLTMPPGHDRQRHSRVSVSVSRRVRTALRGPQEPPPSKPCCVLRHLSSPVGCAPGRARAARLQPSGTARPLFRCGRGLLVKPEHDEMPAEAWRAESGIARGGRVR